MAIYNAIKARHEKHRVRIKAHFAKKRAAAAKPQAKPASKVKTTVIDAGHNPSAAKIARLMKTFPNRKKAAPSYKTKDVAHTKTVVASTKPAATPHSAATKPILTVPKADPSNTSLGRKYQLVAAGIAAAAVGGAAFAGSVQKLPVKSTPKSSKPLKLPTGELAVQRGELAVQRGELAKTKTPKVDVKGLGQRGPGLSAKVHTETVKLAAAVRERVGDPYAKKSASIKTAIGAAERADKRAAAPKPKVVKPVVKDAGFYDVAQLNKIEEKRSLERRAEPREGADRRASVKVPAAPKTPKVKKAVTGSAVGKQRNEVKKARFKKSQAKVVEPSGLTGKARTDRIAELEKSLGQTKHPTPKPSPQQVTGQQPKTDVDFKQPKTPDLPKAPRVTKAETRKLKLQQRERGYRTLAGLEPDGIKAPKPPKTPVLTAPATVSEKQKKRADNKFYRDRDKKYRAKAAEVNPSIPVTSEKHVPAERAQAEANVVKQKQNKARILEIETKLKAGEYSKGPSTTINVNKKNAAQLFGTTEEAISKVARKIDPVKPSIATTAEFEKQMKTAPADVKELQAKINALETNIAKVKPPTSVGAKLRATEAGESIKVEPPKVKAPLGERLPPPKPEKRITVKDALLEQAEAKDTSKPKALPKATVAEATTVKPKLTVPEQLSKTFNAFKNKAISRAGRASLSSPAIGLHAKGKPGSKIKPIVRGGAVIAAALTALQAGEASAAQPDPSKKVKAALGGAKEGAKGLALEVGAWTGGAKLASLAGGSASSALFFGTVLPAAIAIKTAKDYTIPNLERLGLQVEKTATSRREAKEEKAASEKKYGTVFAATRTRHAKEAVKIAQQKRKTLTRLTKIKDKRDTRKAFGLRDV